MILQNLTHSSHDGPYSFNAHWRTKHHTVKKQVSKDSLDCYSVGKTLTQLTELWVKEMSHSQQITYIARNVGIIMGKGCIETNYMAIHVSN